MNSIEANCKCYVDLDGVSKAGELEINLHHCSLHKAAPALLEALEAARDHLDFCGYGDGWERECAREQKLEEKIETAIKQAKGE